MTNLRDLYQEVILDHNKKPRNFGPLEEASHRAHGDNPLCGDKYDIHVAVNDEGVVESVTFSGSGCAISKAAASMMTQHVAGEDLESVREMIDGFRAMLTEEGGDDADLGHLEVFKGVATRPERIKCAVLPWHTLSAALRGQKQVSTEGDDDPFDQSAGSAP